MNIGINQSTGYYQIIELREHNIVLCGLSNDKSIVRCFAGEYSKSSSFSFTLKTSFKTIINCSGDNDLFSIYKINENFGIIGCGVNPLRIQKINYNLELIGDVLEIGDNNYFIDFTPITETKIYIISAKQVENNMFSYYYTIFYFPFCTNDKIVLSFFEQFTLIQLFTLSSSFDLTSKVSHIIILCEPINGEILITDDNSKASLNTIYPADNLYYKPFSSSNDKFDYQAVDITSQPPKQWNSDICSITITVCYQSCLFCNEKGDVLEHHCKRCDTNNGYYPMETLTSNCYNDLTKPDNYFFDNEHQTYSKCYEICGSCTHSGNSENNNCDTCNNALGYYSIEGQKGKCVSGEMTFSGYVLYNNQFFKCHESCKECNKPLIGINQNCLECKDGYMRHPLISTNCVKKCEREGQKWYIDSNNDYHCSDECTDFYSFLIEETNQCVSSCNDFFSCKYCFDNQLLYEYNNKCIKNCPNGISMKNKCNQIIFKQEKPVVIGNTIQYTTQTSKEDFIEIKKQGIELLLQEVNEKNGIISIIKGKDYSLNVYPSNIDSSVLKNSNLPQVNLEECETILREVNEIKDEDDMYICQIVYEPYSSTTATKQIQYEVYSKDNVKLNMEPCDSLSMKIIQPLTNTDNLNIELAKELAEEGIDIYNSSSPIFNDICMPFSMDGKDMTRNNRRDNIFVNVSFCYEGCTLSNVNLTTNEVE